MYIIIINFKELALEEKCVILNCSNFGSSHAVNTKYIFTQ